MCSDVFFFRSKRAAQFWILWTVWRENEGVAGEKRSAIVETWKDERKNKFWTCRVLGQEALNSGDTDKLKKTGFRNERCMGLHGQCAVKNETKTSDLVTKGNVSAVKLETSGRKRGKVLIWYQWAWLLFLSLFKRSLFSAVQLMSGWIEEGVYVFRRRTMVCKYIILLNKSVRTQAAHSYNYCLGSFFGSTRAEARSFEQTGTRKHFLLWQVGGRQYWWMPLQIRKESGYVQLMTERAWLRVNILYCHLETMAGDALEKDMTANPWLSPRYDCWSFIVTSIWLLILYCHLDMTADPWLSPRYDC